MKWRKLGLLWAPDGRRPWAQSHAMLATPVYLEGRIRLLLGVCDAGTVSRVGWIEVDGRDPTRVLAVAEEPVLDIGEPGHFDDNGVNPCSAVTLPDGSVRLYYNGYQLQTKVPYTLFAGLATAPRGDADFTRWAPTPVFERGPSEPIFRTAPFVRRRDDAPGWEAWYIGGAGFHFVEGRRQPRYSLHYATSEDGLHWPSKGRELMAPEGDEIGFGRPWLVRAGAADWRMWYAIRSPRGYAMGYATSTDGQAWTRRDAEAGLDVSPGEWDGDMLCYGAVEHINGAVYMFYNGNGYGRTGLGLAVLESD
jgi:hypothetical protein